MSMNLITLQNLHVFWAHILFGVWFAMWHLTRTTITNEINTKEKCISHGRGDYKCIEETQNIEFSFQLFPFLSLFFSFIRAKSLIVYIRRHHIDHCFLPFTWNLIGLHLIFSSFFFAEWIELVLEISRGLHCMKNISFSNEKNSPNFSTNFEISKSF